MLPLEIEKSPADSLKTSNGYLVLKSGFEWSVSKRRGSSLIGPGGGASGQRGLSCF